MPGGADLGVAVDGSQPYTHHATPFGVTAEQVPATIRAKRLGLPARWVPSPDRLRSFKDLEALSRHVRVQRRGSTAATLTALTFARIVRPDPCILLRNLTCG